MNKEVSVSRSVAVCGATGAVGQEMLRVLEKRDFPLSSLKLLASDRSKGKKLTFRGEEIPVEVLSDRSFKGVEIALMSAGASTSRAFRDAFTTSGAIAIDNSSAFRMDADVPLVVPEVNAEDVQSHNGIIANPNCSTIIMNVPAWPLHEEIGIERVQVATYQAASGAGARAMYELIEETRKYLDGESYERTVIPHQYAFNLFPHNSPLLENGYCQEEWKMVAETRKIFHEPELRVTATCVRVPVLRAHAEALNMTFLRDTSEEEIYEILERAPGVTVSEDRATNTWPMPITASGADDVMVGRVRRDISAPNTFDIWIVGDQLLKGAALNAVQIAELV